MKIQTGNPVSGEDFFIRPKLIEKAWDLIESGNHILIVAPRRVGKTSLMNYLKDNPKNKYCFVYLITESINNENEFYRRIVNKLLKTECVKTSQKIMAFLEKNKPKITKVGPDGVEFGVSDKHDYYDMLGRILISSHDSGKKLIIMIDEFPETLENILTDEGDSAAIHFLGTNRELRQDPEISKNVQFIYTGSIGLENVVSRLNSINKINDLKRLKVTPFTKEESKDFMTLLLENESFRLTETLKDYIMEKIEWLIPFYIQLALDQIKTICKEEEISDVSKETADLAFVQMLDQRNHFEHWHTRLRSSMKGKDYNFSKEMLNLISEREIITTNEIHDLAVKHELIDVYKDLVNSLEYDGYINNHDDPMKYRFNSPILRMWWRENVAN